MEKLKEVLTIFFQEIFTNSSIRLKDFSEKTGWIIDLEVVKNFKLLNRLHELCSSGDFYKAQKLYKRYIINFYTDDEFERMQKAWIKNVTLSSRIEILKQVLKAHRIGLYYVSIPTMLAQIEGYIWAVNEHRGRVEQRKLKEILKNEEHLSIFTASISNYIEEVILAPFELGQDVNSEISRNAILHGYDVNYGTREVSLKLIIMMNVLQAFYENIVFTGKDDPKLAIDLNDLINDPY